MKSVIDKLPDENRRVSRCQQTEMALPSKWYLNEVLLGSWFSNEMEMWGEGEEQVFQSRGKGMGQSMQTWKGHKKARNSGVLEERMRKKQEKSQTTGVRIILGAILEGLDTILRVWDI